MRSHHQDPARALGGRGSAFPGASPVVERGRDRPSAEMRRCPARSRRPRRPAVMAVPLPCRGGPVPRSLRRKDPVRPPRPHGLPPCPHFMAAALPGGLAHAPPGPRTARCPPGRARPAAPRGPVSRRPPGAAGRSRHRGETREGPPRRQTGGKRMYTAAPTPFSRAQLSRAAPKLRPFDPPLRPRSTHPAGLPACDRRPPGGPA